MMNYYYCSLKLTNTLMQLYIYSNINLFYMYVQFSREHKINLVLITLNNK